jgi:hypothetical protein
VKFVRAHHLLDADGVQVTAGLTQYGEVRLLTASGNTEVARLTPELAEKLAAYIHDLALEARTRWDGPRSAGRQS